MKLKHKILIVDDDVDDREIIRDAFMSTSQDQDYFFIENGEKLIEYLEAESNDQLPSLILLDLNMPGKDGRETLKELKLNKRYQCIPTLVFTTSSSIRDKKNAYELGANCFITKPDTFNKLVDLAKCINKLWL
jgi:Response regulator containing CheY-like receiver, AAA-type ATPase, and DNA-binding domains